MRGAADIVRRVKNGFIDGLPHCWLNPHPPDADDWMDVEVHLRFLSPDFKRYGDPEVFEMTAGEFRAAVHEIFVWNSRKLGGESA